MSHPRVEAIVRHFPENGLKLLLENPGNVRDLLNLLEVAVLPRIDFARLKVDPTQFVQRDYRHLESDLVLHAPLLGPHGGRGRRVTIYILIEHQSQPNPFMIFRVLEYVVLIYKRQLLHWQARHGSLEGFRFQPVLPIVVYSGTRSWEGLGRLVDLVEQGEQFAAVTPTLAPLFLNLSRTRLADLQSRGGAFGQVLRLLHRRRAPLPEFESLLRQVVQELEAMPAAERLRWLELLSYIQALVYYERDPVEHESLQGRIAASVQTDTHRREVFDMARSMAEILIEKGRKEGEEKGREQALHQTLLRQLRKKFGRLPAKVVKRVEATSDLDQLNAWLDQVVTAQELAEVGILPLE